MTAPADPSIARYIVPTLLILFAAVLRFAAIGAQELWLDETLSWYAATSNDLTAVVLSDNTPPLYYILLRAWVSLFGDSRTALRLLSAAEGTAWVAAVMWWTRILFDRRAALWAGLWAVLAPMAIYYSQEVRAYAQLTLLLTITYGCISKALITNRGVWWVAATVAATAALYTHLVPLALMWCVALLTAGSSPASWRRGGLAATAVILAFLPGLIAAWAARGRSPDGLDWVAAVWEQTPPSLAVLRSLEVLTLGGDAGLLPAKFKQLSLLEFPQSLHLLALTGLVLLVIVAASRCGEGEDAGASRWKWALGLLIIGPLVLLWSLSWIRPLYVVGRYDQIALPACPVLLGFACAKLQARRGAVLSAAVALLLLLPISCKLWLYYRAPASDGGARAAAVLDTRARNGDVFVFTELRALPMIYELSRLGYRFAGERCDDSRGRRFGCRPYPRDPYGRMGISLPPAPASAGDAGEIAQLRAAESNSVWMILGNYRTGTGELAATPSSAALMRRLEDLGLKPSSADVAAGIVEYRPRPAD